MIQELYKKAKNNKVELSLNKREADSLHKEIEKFFSTPKMQHVTYRAEYCLKSGLTYFLPNLQVKVGKRKYEIKSDKRRNQPSC